MKRIAKKTVWLFLLGLLVSVPVFAQEMFNEELIQELKAMKSRIIELEAQVQGLKVLAAAPKEKHGGKAAGGSNLADRVRNIEEKMGDGSVLGKWTDNLAITGLVEVEAGYEDMSFAAGVLDEDSSDIALSTVELGIDVDIAKHVGGHMLLLWEEDDTEPVDVDEAFIMLDGEDVVPFYLAAGKMYVPFGNFESHFISDPLTLELGETRESAVRIGYVNDRVEISATVFNGDINETGDDDHIKGFVGNARFIMPENSLQGVDLSMGVSYISNIADSDGLEGEMVKGSVDDSVAGFSAFLNATVMDRFFFEAEYVGALDEFKAGELSFDGGQEFQPTTWNIEFAVAATENLKAAIKCEGGEDLGDFMPEIQYGAAVSYDLFKNTTLSLEYLYGEFENDDERDLVTTQLAIEF